MQYPEMFTSTVAMLTFAQSTVIPREIMAFRTLLRVAEYYDRRTKTTTRVDPGGCWAAQTTLTGGQGHGAGRFQGTGKETM